MNLKILSILFTSLITYLAHAEDDRVCNLAEEGGISYHPYPRDNWSGRALVCEITFLNGAYGNGEPVSTIYYSNAGTCMQALLLMDKSYDKHPNAGYYTTTNYPITEVLKIASGITRLAGRKLNLVIGSHGSEDDWNFTVKTLPSSTCRKGPENFYFKNLYKIAGIANKELSGIIRTFYSSETHDFYFEDIFKPKAPKIYKPDRQKDEKRF